MKSIKGREHSKKKMLKGSCFKQARENFELIRFTTATAIKASLNLLLSW